MNCSKIFFFLVFIFSIFNFPILECRDVYIAKMESCYNMPRSSRHAPSSPSQELKDFIRHNPYEEAQSREFRRSVEERLRLEQVERMNRESAQRREEELRRQNQIEVERKAVRLAAEKRAKEEVERQVRLEVERRKKEGEKRAREEEERKRQEKEERQAFFQELEQKRKAWVDREEEKLIEEEKEKEEFEARKEAKLQERLAFEKELESKNFLKKAYDYVTGFFEKEELLSDEKLKLQIMESEFEKIKSFGGITEYEAEISHLGLKFTRNAQNLIDGDSFEDFKQYKVDVIRSEAIFATLSLLDGREQKTVTHNLNPHTNSYIKQLDLDLQNFTCCSGDYVQRHLHEEVVTVVNRSSDLLDAHITNFQIASISTLIYHAADEAVLCNRDKEIERGFALSDFCFSMLEFEKQNAMLIIKGIDVSLQAVVATGKGVCVGLFNVGKFTANTFIHPIVTTTEMAKTLVKAVMYLGKAALLVYRDPEKFKTKVVELGEKSKAMTSEIATYIVEEPSEALANSVAFVTEFFFIKKIPTFQSIAFNKAKKISKIIKVLHEESKLAKNIPDLKLQKVVTPLTQTIKQTTKIIKTASKYGVENTKSALQTLQKNLYLTHGEKPTLLLKALTKFKEAFPKGHVNWKHVFCRYFNKKRNRIEGFHHKHSATESIVEIITNPNKHGIYKATYEYMGCKKISTFFPDNWNRAKVIKKIKEAYKNPVVKQNSGFIGLTKEGMPIQFWFKKNKTGKITINSIYPRIDDVL